MGFLNSGVSLLSNKTIPEKWLIEHGSNESGDNKVLWALFANGKNQLFHTAYVIKMEGVMSNKVRNEYANQLGFHFYLIFFF